MCLLSQLKTEKFGRKMYQKLVLLVVWLKNRGSEGPEALT